MFGTALTVSAWANTMPIVHPKSMLSTDFKATIYTKYICVA